MKISVALCTYNGTKHVAMQLESIFNQTVPVNEIVICDDGSTDDTIIIITGFIKLHPGIICLHINKTNLGAKSNFEQAIQLCTGDIIFLSDQDDIWLSEKVSKTLLFFKNNLNATVVFSNGNLINDEDEVLPYTIWDSIGFSEKLRINLNSVQLFEFLIVINNIVTGAAMCLKKEACGYIFPFFCPDLYWHDYWISLAAAYKNELYFIEDKLINYRLHSNQQASLPQLNDFYKKHNSIKEMLWLKQYDKGNTERLYNSYIGSKKRNDLFAPQLNSIFSSDDRVKKLNTFIFNEMETLKRKLFSEMSFFARKKLFVIWLLGRQKTYTITRNDLIKLLFT